MPEASKRPGSSASAVYAGTAISRAKQTQPFMVADATMGRAG